MCLSCQFKLLSLERGTKGSLLRLAVSMGSACHAHADALLEDDEMSGTTPGSITTRSRRPGNPPENQCNRRRTQKLYPIGDRCGYRFFAECRLIISGIWAFCERIQLVVMADPLKESVVPNEEAPNAQNIMVKPTTSKMTQTGRSNTTDIGT